MRSKCSVPDCERFGQSRELCAKHYMRWFRYGDPLILKQPAKSRPIEERFWSHVDPCRTDGCMIWVGGRRGGKGNDYGEFRVEGVLTYAHHFLVGDPPAGLVWDHVRERGCTNKTCVWPEHLELVTRIENARRRV